MGARNRSGIILQSSKPIWSEMLIVDKLVAGYGKKQVLFGLDLEVDKGRITALIGPNGSGKSTALKAIFSLIPVWQGSVTWNGNSITNRKTRENVKEGIAFAPQGNQVFDEMTVLENLKIGGLQLSEKKFQSEINKIWFLFPELEQRQQQNSGKLSGGEKQMLSLGRALINSPDLLLMDEPSLGLSPKLVHFIMGHIYKINQELGVTILIVEQKVRKVLEIADRVYSVKLGKIVFAGTAVELQQNEKKLKQLFL